jgi:hypothetical protein
MRSLKNSVFWDVTLNLLGLLDPDDEGVISFRNVCSYSPSDSVTSQKNGSEGNYVGVQKKRVILSTQTPK